MEEIKVFLKISFARNVRGARYKKFPLGTMRTPIDGITLIVKCRASNLDKVLQVTKECREKSSTRNHILVIQ